MRWSYRRIGQEGIPPLIVYPLQYPPQDSQDKRTEADRVFIYLLSTSTLFRSGSAQHALWAAMPPLWTPCVHTNPHSVGTFRRTASPSDRLLRLVHSPSRTAYTAPNIGGISGRETVTREAYNQHWWRTSVHSPPLSECDRVLHGAHRVSGNARLFACTWHGSLGRVECIFASHRPSDVPLGLPVLLSQALPHDRWTRPRVAAYTVGNSMNEAPVVTRDAPVDRNVLLSIVLMAGITPPRFLAYCSAMWSSQVGLTALRTQQA